jgi:hypothetical protein
VRKLKAVPHNHFNVCGDAFPEDPSNWISEGATKVDGCYPNIDTINWGQLGAVRVCCNLPRTKGRLDNFVIECFDNKTNRRANNYLHAIASREVLKSVFTSKKVKLFRRCEEPVIAAAAPLNNPI